MVNIVSKTYKRTIFQYVLLLLFSIILSFFVPLYWSQNMALFHTFSELFCVFIALSSFIIIFQVNKYNPNVHLLMGLGFLMIAVFDFFHTFYYQAFPWYPQNYYDITTEYWILGRLAESLLFLVAVKKIDIKTNRYLGSLITFGISLTFSFSVLYFPRIFPVLLLTGSGVTPVKIFLEYLIIALFLLSIYYFHLEIRKENAITPNRYLILALMFAIPAEICFTLYTVIDNYTVVLGHILKICSYCYIFKAIFVDSIIYPYIELEKSRNIMTKAFNCFPLAITSFDENLKLTFANTRAKEILASHDEELRGLNSEMFSTKFNMKFRDNEQLCDLTNLDGQQNIIKIDSYSLQRYGFMYIFEEAKRDQELKNLQLQTKTLLDSINVDSQEFLQTHSV